MGDIVGINGQKPEEVIEDQAFDNFMGFCLIPLICKWVGGVDEEMAGFVSDEFMDGIRVSYENCDPRIDGEGKDFLLECTEEMRNLKDALREVMLKYKNEMEGIL